MFSKFDWLLVLFLTFVVAFLGSIWYDNLTGFLSFGVLVVGMSVWFYMKQLNKGT